MKPLDIQTPADDKLDHHFRKQARTLAAFDFRRPTLPVSIRSRSSTYSCSRRPIPRTQSPATDVERMRNFSLSAGGIENKGDSFRIIAQVTGSPGSATQSTEATRRVSRKRGAVRWEQRLYPASIAPQDDCEDFLRPVCNSIGSCSPRGNFRIKVIGDKSVGKSMMIKQMTTSQFIGLQEIQDKTNFTSVSLSLDGEESTLELEEVEIDKTYRPTVYVDAFIMMYSISDEASFRYILREVSRLRDRMDVDRPIIMVANKTDLNRTRTVSASEGKSTAHLYGCKYLETSVSFQVRVDELLVALVRQIRLTLDPRAAIHRPAGECRGVGRRLPRRFFKARTLLQRLFGRKSKSKRKRETCEEIFKL